MKPNPDTATARRVPPGRRRILAYDALRLFSILTVVAIHCFMPLRDALPHTDPVFIIDDLLHYAVPVFVFISGALVWARPWKGGPGAFRRFANARLKAVGAPYVAWALLYLAISVGAARNPLSRLLEAPGLLLSGHVWYHLYFVPMLLTFYALTPLARRALARSPEATVIAAYAVRLVLWPLISPLLRAVGPALVWSWCVHVAAHLPDMALGAWFALRLDAIPRQLRRSWPLPVALGGAGLAALSAGALASWPSLLRNPVHAAAMTALVLGMALCAFELEPHYERFARPIIAGAALSFGVYLIHPLVLDGLRAATHATGTDAVWLAWWAFPTSWAVISATSLTVSWLLLRSPKTQWLVGARTGSGG